MLIAEAILVGLLIGGVVGALGAGGGILSVPALIFFLGYSPHTAAAGSLVVVGLTSLSSLLFRARRREVAWSRGLIFAAVSILGTLAGTALGAQISGRLLMFLFAGLMAVVGVVMLWRAARAGKSTPANPAENTAEDTANSGTPPPSAWRKILQTVLVALVTGLLTGLFGVGGGFLIVPALVMMGMQMRLAAGTSLLIMVITSVSGLLARLPDGFAGITWPALLLFAAASMLGGMLGGPLTRKVSNRALTAVFGILLLAISAYTAISTALGG
ncbi:hypothetical protein SAMN05421878_10936 [Actinobaculum suis]|uniref:Probable membrane transporter protein n=1 Tax=Actinobaculum suis TaxID=1657 RepID=A0A1G7CYY8_9ACTO|nr:sulfite exporter TauE/SafE family protein [Actinobaculum suis]MDY5152787.1 sulfite exporter TauE/SafE family protein [Actinobaculum suis]SDE44489.1 hypothetical protein SAMN05421878_10936 [Actinobaculum suis]